MEAAYHHIHIFRTNIRKENLRQIKKVFDKTRRISHWNVDTEDCDLVLRVVSSHLSETEIMSLVCENGFECADLA